MRTIATRTALSMAGLAIALLAGCAPGTPGSSSSPIGSLSISPSASPTATTPSYEGRNPGMGDDEALARVEHPATGETWFDTPQQIATPAWAAGDEYLDQEGWTAWYELGTRADHTIVGFQAVTVTDLFERDTAGNYEWIAYPTAKDDPATPLPFVYSGVPQNTVVFYDSLTLPTQLVLPTGEPLAVPQGDHGGFEAPGMGATELPAGDVIETFGAYQVTRIVSPMDWIWSGPYTVTAPAGLSYSDLYYVLTTPYGMYIPLEYNAFGSLADISWTIPDTVGSDGMMVRLADLMDVGCGEHDSDHNTVVTGASPSDWVVAGTSSRGETLYIPSSGNPLVTPMFGAYTQSQELFGLTPVSVTAFLNAPALIGYQAPDSGNFLVYLNGAYSGRAWC